MGHAVGADDDVMVGIDWGMSTAELSNAKLLIVSPSPNKSLVCRSGSVAPGNIVWLLSATPEVGVAPLEYRGSLRLKLTLVGPSLANVSSLPTAVDEGGANEEFSKEEEGEEEDE